MPESDPRQELADAFGRELDPLAQFEETFIETEIDPFELYEENRLASKDLSDSTVEEYRRSFRQWREFMDQQGRHPACPNESHITGFIKYHRDERGNSVGTIKNRLMYLNQAYQYWQDDAAFPHPQDYNPIDLAKATADLTHEGPKEPPRLSVDELRGKVEEITHIRDRAIVLMQLKLGLRATEVCNIKLSEIHLSNRDVQDHYDSMGEAKALKERNRKHAVYIPHERDGNKSRKPRMLPLDDELRRALLRYLLIRPDNGEPWLFLSQTTREQMTKQGVNEIWKSAFQPEYAETEDYRGITSHFGRHRFTTYWRVEQDLNRELIKYMRGDTAGSANLKDRGAIDEYIHTYYEDIEPIYREQIYKLSV
ncbi:tyrosine-type recombinase/integrase [Halobacterium salinarum]|uniref:Integrase/recombinase XerD n=2 Tax=Halobacterium salinarum TaxID=2242 RepID=A0A841HEA6_HALSI|nr:site-specific integrase [Halobacterium salinarum]MBB6090759.1 integrase/recombinase XerD [Halobacterium salinarum]MDL0142293.1 site-specific integrase [Halobacterium salinarum]UEB92238.1 site-specific integrase [Halobacterium salinarum NRC-34001]